MSGLLIANDTIKVFAPEQESPSHKFVTRYFYIKKFKSVLKCLAYVQKCCYNMLQYHRRSQFNTDVEALEREK